jgi:hypothetical protein
MFLYITISLILLNLQRVRYLLRKPVLLNIYKNFYYNDTI